MDYKLMLVALFIPLVNSDCKQGVGRCEWEPWGHWSSCSRKCAGYRTRRRDMCCGIHVPDCIDKCHRPNTSVESEPCETHCPNGASYMDGICHCPPLRYGICCEGNETTFDNDDVFCARPCTWTNWFSWSKCTERCGCGKRTRKRARCCHNVNGSCAEDCNLYDNTDERTCTAACSTSNYPNPCELCTWNTWTTWTPCSQECGGGQRSRTRTPCCCSGQKGVEDCLYDCGLSASDAKEMKPCGEICHNQGHYISGNCSCGKGFSGQCCQNELMENNCTKCSLYRWNPWSPCSQTCGGGQRTRNRTLCCRIGQDVDDCTRQCSLDESVLTEREACEEMCCGTSFYSYIITGAGSAVGTLFITVLICCICQRLRGRKKEVENVYETPGPSESEHQNRCYSDAAYMEISGITGEELY